MTEPMTRKQFATVTPRDFGNGAVQDEIDEALKQREELLVELEMVREGIRQVIAAFEHALEETELKLK